MTSVKTHIIINPAAGRPVPVLHPINAFCARQGIDWEVAVTKPGRIRQLTEDAVKRGAGRILVYGGDGSVADTAGALVGSDVPLGILPGGTANVMAAELGIPRDLPEALEALLDQKSGIRKIDVGLINDRVFILRVGLGLEAEFMRRADRESKNVWGWLAYAFSGMSAMVNTRPARYDFTVDGVQHSRQGMGLIVANSGNVGLPGLSFIPDVDIADGRLDVVLIRPADLRCILDRDASHKADSTEPLGLFERWQGSDIRIGSDPVQPVQYDGEVCDAHDLRITVAPRSLQMIVPK